MVLSKEESPIYDIKIASVGPGYISGQDAVQELTGMDLAMKLHYIRTVYYFSSQAFEGLTMTRLKESIFYWLNHAYIPCGRFRKSESGRPYVKCNDCGIRWIEARCDMSLDEWLESRDDARHKLVVPTQVLGPDLFYSPLVLLQFTKFKCEGTAIGLSWAHVLGDPFTAVAFMNLWAEVIRNQFPAQPLRMAHSNYQPRNSKRPVSDPLSVKRVGPVGDHWVAPNDTKMETYSFFVSRAGLSHLQSKICGDKGTRQILIPPFESICAAVWQCVGKVKHGSGGVKTVTICKKNPEKSFQGVFTNKAQTIKVVQLKTELSPKELGLLIMNQAVDETDMIEEAVESGNELPDFIVYGVNLTFVDLCDAPVYDFDVRGNKPVDVNCSIDNVGDEGLVLVYPSRKDERDGVRVSISVEEKYVRDVKSMLMKDWTLG